MAERRNRKHSKIDGLPPDLKATVQQMLLDGDTYSEVIAYLQTQGVSISMSSVCRYAQAYLAEHEALMMANANLQRMMDEVSKYPDLDTTEAIIRIVSHNLLNVLSNTSEEDWQEVNLSKLLKETNALVRASAYKKRIALQNQDALDTGLDAVKGLVFAEACQGAARTVPATGRVRGRQKGDRDYRGRITCYVVCLTGQDRRRDQGAGRAAR